MLLYIKEDKILNNSSLIYCNGNVINRDIKCKVLLEEICVSFGSTLQGRIDAFKRLVNVCQRIPVILIESKNYILFPVDSNDDVYWINFAYIKRATIINDYQYLVNFDNGTSIMINSSVRSFRKQVNRCKQYISITEEREKFIFNISI